MIEQSRRPLLSSSNELGTLQQRANEQRKRHQQGQQSSQRWQQVRTAINLPIHSATRLPARFLLHTIIALVLPLALLLTQLHPGTAPAATSSATLPSNDNSADFVVPVAPLSLDTAPLVGDPSALNDDEIPVPLTLSSRSAALAPVVVASTIAGDRVLLRNGPGTNYDSVGKMTTNTPVQIIGKHGDWFQIRESVDKPVYWVSGELLNIPNGAIYTLDDVADSAIPAPPPAKIAQVREEGLSVRDGPGTNYIPLGKLQAGTQIDLLEQYQGWLHVGVPGGNDGWVKAEFLNVQDGVLNRLVTADTLPDANPAMVGTINDNSVNLRKGPDSKYDSAGKLGNGTQVSLIGQYKDWFKIKTANGTLAWVFNDFLDSSAHILRRVPTTSDFPALPKPQITNNVTSQKSGGRTGGGSSSASVPISAGSSSIAGFATQFSGAAYVYGAAGPRAFDCSGFTMYVYRQFGVSLPHSAAAQYNAGARISSMSALAPGDLVFFAGTAGERGISHVALYIGGGRIIHAMTPRYGVAVSNIHESYWVNHFAGGTRILR